MATRGLAIAAALATNAETSDEEDGEAAESHGGGMARFLPLLPAVAAISCIFCAFSITPGEELKLSNFSVSVVALGAAGALAMFAAVLWDLYETYMKERAKKNEKAKTS